MKTTSDRTDLDRLKAAVTGRQVAELLGLQGRGRRYWCPACQTDGGRTPDLSVTDTGFRCFKCNVHGDAVELVKLVRRIDFPTALDWLAAATGQARRNGRTETTRRTRKPPEPRTHAGTAYPTHRQSTESAASHGDAYAAFLDGCRPVEGSALAYLTGRGIDADVVAHLGLRFCGREYAELMTRLEAGFGRDALQAAGLLATGKRGPYPTFWSYYSKQIGFLVLPYIQDRHPVYLKARPPLDKATAEAKDVPRFLNTGRAVPCLYNVDILGDADRVLICEGETDTLTALSHGYAAVGIPGWSHFKPAWVELFCGKTVFLVLDADRAGDQGVRDIARTFDRAGLPLPRRVTLPAGSDLNEFLTEGWKDGQKA
jgi:DNA primase